MDLTPKPLKLKQQRKQHFFAWMVMAIAALAFNGLWAGYSYWSYYQASSNHEKSRLHYEQLQDNIKTLNNARNDLLRWRNRLVVLDKLGRFPDYTYITDYLTQNCPEMIFLSDLAFQHAKHGYSTNSIQDASLPKSAKMFRLNSDTAHTDSVSSKESIITMSIKGHSINHQHVADFLRILKASRLFLNAQLIESKRLLRSQEDRIVFEIKCMLSPYSMVENPDYANKDQTQLY